MRSCYFCGLSQSQIEFLDAEPLKKFEMRRLNEGGNEEVSDIEAHASCNAFFWSKRSSPLRAALDDGLTELEQQTK